MGIAELTLVALTAAWVVAGAGYLLVRRLMPKQNRGPGAPWEAASGEAQKFAAKWRIANAIAPHAGGIARLWDVYFVAVQPAYERNAIESTRRALRDHSTQAPPSRFEVTEDAWEVYVACPHDAQEGSLTEHIFVELIFPYDPFFPDWIVQVESRRGVLCRKDWAFRCSIDLDALDAGARKRPAGS